MTGLRNSLHSTVRAVALAAAALVAVAGMATRPTTASAATSGRGYLPFRAGTVVHVYQGNGSDPGCSTHCTQPDYYAWDFGRPSGSSAGMPVVSATSGTIIGVRNTYVGTCTNFNSSCAFGNYVFVHDDDGSYVEYLHMQTGSVVVTPNHRIAVGDPVGQVGATGYTGGFAHLHFSWLAVAAGTGDSPSVGNSIAGSFVGLAHPTTNQDVTSNNPASPYAYALTSVAYTRPDGTTPLDPNHAFAGMTGFVRVTVQNTGSVTWNSDGTPWRIGTQSPANHSSLLATPAWLSAGRPVQLAAGVTVAPGASTTFTFPFTVPLVQAATVGDSFGIVDEGVRWLSGPMITPSFTYTTTIDRGVAARHHGAGGYTVAPDGTVAPFGGAPALAGTGTARWPGWDIARGIVLRGDDAGGYVLDGWGGVHPFGSAPGLATTAYWKGWDIARAIVLRGDDAGGYVLDGWGGVHPFGSAPGLATTAYWKGWDIARGIVLRGDDAGGYVLDGWGGIHPLGNAPGLTTYTYWQGWDVARGLTLASDTTGFVVDGAGVTHSFS